MSSGGSMSSGPARRGRRRVRALVLGIAILGVASVLGWCTMIRMPGESQRSPLPPPTEEHRALAEELARVVRGLALEVGERNLSNPERLEQAARLVELWLAETGLTVQRETFEAARGRTVRNLWVEVPGRDPAAGLVVVGAHYDSAPGSPGADDNATGVAALLALARRFAGAAPARGLRFVAFVNEEPPWFQTEGMGSWVHARGLAERGAEVAAMLSLESLGYFDETPGSQGYPLPFLRWLYGSRGDYVAWVGNVSSRALVRCCVRAFRAGTAFPSAGAALPAWIPGVGWSDQWAFWEHGYPGVMVTDTAPFRNPRYHTPLDLPEELDLEKLARVVVGVRAVVAELAGVE